MRPLVSPLWPLLLWTLPIGGTHLSGQEPRPVAYVLNLTGTWQLEGHHGAVRIGQPLDASSKLSTASDNYDNSITIMRCDDLSRLQIACKDAANNPCRNPIAISPVPSEAPAGRLKTLTAAALSLLLDKPPAVAGHFSATLSRGEYVIAEMEEVVPIRNPNGFSITEAFPPLPIGRYLVSVTKDDGKTSLFSEKIAHLPDGSWQTFRIAARGLYMISVTDSDEERRADLLLLLLPGAEYRAAKERFDAVKSYTSKWRGSNAQVDEHLVLRAVLLSMSQPS